MVDWDHVDSVVHVWDHAELDAALNQAPDEVIRVGHFKRWLGKA